MPNITVDIPAGIVTDDTALASSGAWMDCNNVRFWRGRAQVVGGWERFLIGKLNGICRNILPWTDKEGVLTVAFGQHDALEIGRGGAVYDITPVEFTEGSVDGTGGAGYGTGAYGLSTYGEPSNVDTFPLTWSFANYGESLMANPRGQTIFWWQNDTSQVAEPLANAPAEVSYTLVTDTRQVIAFGCNEEESGAFNPMCIRFSDIEDPEDWTTALDNNAGEVILEGGARIVGARIVGDYIFVWTDNALFRGSFTGDSAQPWAFEKIDEHCGLIGPNAAVIVSGVAYWLGPDVQFRQCALGGVPQVIVSPIQSDLKDHMPIIQADKVVASSCSEFGEVRFDYPDGRDDLGRGNLVLAVDQFETELSVTLDQSTALLITATAQQAGIENSRYVVMSVVDGAWSKGIMPRTAYVDSSPQPYPLGVEPDGEVYLQERGHTADGGPIDWYIQSSDLYVGDAAEPMMMIKSLMPDFRGQLGPVQLQITTKRYAQGNEYHKGPYALDPNKQLRTFMATGRVVRFRFYGNTSPSYVRLGRQIFDVVPTGLQ